MRSFEPRRVAIALLAAALCALPPATAAQRSFGESTEVVVVEVPVQVIKDGEPVRGLTANDFELYDGRKKVAITGFEALDLAAAPGAGQAPVAASARRHFLLLFDLVFSDPNALLRAREAAKAVLADLHPTDLVSVVTYTAASGPQMVLGFTPDRAQAAAAIDVLGLPKFFTPATDPLRLVFTDSGGLQKMAPGSSGPRAGAAGGEGPAAAGGAVVTDRDQQLLDQLKNVNILSSRAEKSVDQLIVRNMTESFANLARMMSEVDGRKYVVLLSEGFDSSLVTGSGGGEAGLNDLQRSVDAAGDPDQISGSDFGSGSDAQYGNTRTLNRLEKMLTELRRADCQVEAIDIAGLRALANEGRLTANGRESLATMAKSTGGELFENFNDLRAAMGQMLRRTGVTYVLSFQPESLKADDDFRKLRVELKNAGRGARVVHRPGYYAPHPYGERPPLQRLLETADAVMGEESGSIGSAVLAVPFAAGGERAYVPVVIEVDGATLLAGKHEQKLPIEIYAYAFDEHGSVQDFLTQSFALDVGKAEAALRQSGFKFFGHLSLPKGTYSLRTLVRNGATGASSLRVDEVQVPALGSGEPGLLPALFPETPGRWVMVRETLPPGSPQPPYPFMLKGQPYIPSSRPVLAAGQPAAMVLQGYHLTPGALKAVAAVLAADGKEVPGGAIKLTASESGGAGVLRLNATFEPPALQPGEYRLRVTVTDGAGKAQSSVARFAVGGAPAAGGR